MDLDREYSVHKKNNMDLIPSLSSSEKIDEINSDRDKKMPNSNAQTCCPCPMPRALPLS
jgi:hypothetical protein